MKGIFKDIQNGGRSLLREPAFTLPSLITLSLGIAAVTVIFTVVQHVSFSSLGLANPEQLVTLRQNVPGISPIIPMSGQVMQELRLANQGRHEISSLDLSYYSIPEVGLARRWQVARVSENFFQLCGSVPRLGRHLSASDFSGNRREVAVISTRLWESLFGGRPDILGRQITVEAVGAAPPPGFTPLLTIVGVLPRDFWLPWGEIDLVLPQFPETESPTATAPNLFALARLNSQMSRQAALGQLDQSYRGIEFADRLPREGRALTIRNLPELHGGQIVSELRLLWLASGALLLVICANLANLVQARTSRRRGEAALRYALGANRFEALRKPLVETVLLAILGGVVGILLSYLSTNLLRSIPAVGLPRPQDLQLNSNVLLFSMAAILLSLLCFGVIPVILESRKPLSNALQLISGRTTDGRRAGRVRSGVVTVETAVAVALLFLATAALGSLARLRSIETGFQVDGNLVFQVDLPVSRISEPQQQQLVLDGILREYRALPGVTSVAIANTLPLSFTNSILRYGTEPGEINYRANVRRVSTDYFAAMGISLIAGRDLIQDDIDNRRPVTVVNRKLAAQHWPGESALGHHLTLNPTTQLEIVGVVGDVRQWQLTDPPEPGLYLPLQPMGSASVVVRSDLEAASLVESIRSATRRVDPKLILYSFTSLRERINLNIGSDRLTAGILNGFALLCLILGAVGVYSVMSYSVAGRRREIGIRMALGAGGREIRWQLIREGITPALIGTALGLIGALAGTVLLESIFYDFTASDSRLWLVGPVLLNLAALAALWIPASAAARLDPQIALRQD